MREIHRQSLEMGDECKAMVRTGSAIAQSSGAPTVQRLPVPQHAL